MAWYRTGTITLVNGSDVVLGAGTAWVANALPGDILSVPGAVLEVKRIVSDGELQLATAYAGAGGAGLSYALVPTQGYVPEALQAMQQILGEFGDLWQAWKAGDLYGRGLVLKGSLAAVEDLPTTGNTAGDGYMVATSKLYVWNGSAWSYAGEMITSTELLLLREDVRQAREDVLSAKLAIEGYVSEVDSQTAIAQGAALAALGVLNLQPDEATGLANTTSGQIFSTLTTVDGAVKLIAYVNDAGVARKILDPPTSAAFSALVGTVTAIQAQLNLAQLRLDGLDQEVIEANAAVMQLSNIFLSRAISQQE